MNRQRIVTATLIILLFGILLVLSIRRDRSRPATFVVWFTIKTNAHDVSVAGDFNHWSQTADPMHRQTDGTWMTKVQLAGGRHQYSFVVDDKWIPDPENPNQVDNGHGGKNSVMVIGR
jgi:1,4-alpha-glucan branching enzyme